MIKLKRSKEKLETSIRPREEIQRESPVEQLRERSRAERKETIRKAEYENHERMHEKSGRKEWGNVR